MSNTAELLSPVGRLVQGSLYVGQTTDAEGKPLVYKTGPNAGQPRVAFYFALALQKGSEKHWSETKWGKEIWQIGHSSFPGGQAALPTFAWKIVDGDSDIPNRLGRKPCEREGYPGHWVLNLTSSFAPRIFDEYGSQQLLQADHVKLGDFIQVYGNIAGNGKTQQPGIYLNHSMVAFSRYGTRILMGVDPKSVGFGNSPIPAGASLTPLESGFNPATPVSNPNVPPLYNPAPPAPIANPTAVPPYPGILTPPKAPAIIMLPNAQGATYEQLLAAGWTHELLVQHAMIQA